MNHIYWNMYHTDTFVCLQKEPDVDIEELLRTTVASDSKVRQLIL